MKKKRSQGANGIDPPPRIAVVLGRRVRQWRQARGIPLKHVAADLSVSVSVISQWERGLRFPSVRNLERLAKYMGVRLCCLFWGGPGECHTCRTGSLGGITSPAEGGCGRGGRS